MIQKQKKLNTPLVSIVVPTYNRAHMLSKAIECISDQSYDNLEIIIVNDGSKDNTKPEIDKIINKDPRIFAYHKPNSGIANTLNYGFERTRGKYVTWNSDDNYYHKNAIELMVKYLEHKPDIDFVYTDARDVDKEGKIIAYFKAGPPMNLLKYCNIRGCLLYRRRVNKIVGPYDSKWPTVQDYNFYRRAYEKVRMGYIPLAPYDYTVHKESMSGPHIDCVLELGRHQEEFATSNRERRENWAWCYDEIARTENNTGRKWHSVYNLMRASLYEPSRGFKLIDSLLRALYQAIPDPVKNIWRDIKPKNWHF